MLYLRFLSVKPAYIHLVFLVKSCNQRLQYTLHVYRLFWFVCLFVFFLDLHRLSELQELPVDVEPYVKKLMNSRRRVMLVNNILQNAQVRNVQWGPVMPDISWLLMASKYKFLAKTWESLGWAIIAIIFACPSGVFWKLLTLNLCYKTLLRTQNTIMCLLSLHVGEAWKTSPKCHKRDSQKKSFTGTFWILVLTWNYEDLRINKLENTVHVHTLFA